MPSPSDFAHADLNKVVESLTLDEAISLVAGVGWWYTASIPRLGIPAIKPSGIGRPNGVRGNRFYDATPAKAIPCATALASTFDPDLIETVASKLLAAEAKLRSASVILGPTVNIQRSPLGGRGFESFSEDPYLSGTIAAAYIGGLQSKGIGACIKHFVANDQEDDRQGVSSEVSPRALREIYLMPFMIAQKFAKPWAYMAAYNKINGIHASENSWLLKEVLRGDWRSDSMVMSDWFGVYSVAEPIKAGLDLEMPGPDKWRTRQHMSRSVHSRTFTADDIKSRARKVLELVQKCARGAPENLNGRDEEQSDDNEEDKQLMQSLASQTITLLKNEGGLLPLSINSLKRIAIIGGNAKANIISGGGAASVTPSFVVNPFGGITRSLSEDTKVLYSEGAQTFKTLPPFEREIMAADGSIGFDGAWHSHDEHNRPTLQPVELCRIKTCMIFVAHSAPSSLTKSWTLRLKGRSKPREDDTLYNFGCTVDGRAKIYIDGDLVVDNWTVQRHGGTFFGGGTVEERGQYLLKKGVSHEVTVEFENISACNPDGIPNVVEIPAVQIGAAAVIDPDQEIEKAVAIAKEADVAVVVIGLNSDWETSGADRTSLKLPGRADELVRRVAEANEKTVVITQSGSSIEMPWVDKVPSILHAWYLGNSCGDAIADVLFGKFNPCSKLSLTFPRRLEDTPSYGHFGSQNGTVWYAEDLFVGYKHYVHTNTPTLFPFGHGLSYTTFGFSDLQVTEPLGPDLQFYATVTVQNTGGVTGSEIVQIYVTPSSETKLTHPVRSLRGYGKARNLEAGHSVKVQVNLDKYALSYWCLVQNRWKVERGTYQVILGTSSENVILQSEVKVPKEIFWDGL